MEWVAKRNLTGGGAIVDGVERRRDEANMEVWLVGEEVQRDRGDVLSEQVVREEA